MPEGNKKSKIWIWVVIIVVVIFIIATIGVAAIWLLLGNDYGSSLPDTSFEGGMMNNEISQVPSAALKNSESIMLPNEDGFDSSETEDFDGVEQKIIKTGTLDMVVKSVSSAADDITKRATTNDGFVQSSNVRTDEDGDQFATVIIKVPADKFEQLMREIKELALRVEVENSSGQDVTEEFVDLEAQVKSLRAQEEQYLVILDKADTVTDILEVTRQLNYVRSEIERAEGRVKYLENLTDLSTISVYLSQEVRVDLPTSDWKPLTNLKEAFRAWVEVLQWFADAFVWIVLFMGPPTLVIWLIVWLIVRRARKKKQG